MLSCVCEYGSQRSKIETSSNRMSATSAFGQPKVWHRGCRRALVSFQVGTLIASTIECRVQVRLSDQDAAHRFVFSEHVPYHAQGSEGCWGAKSVKTCTGRETQRPLHVARLVNLCPDYVMCCRPRRLHTSCKRIQSCKTLSPYSVGHHAKLPRAMLNCTLYTASVELATCDAERGKSQMCRFLAYLTLLGDAWERLGTRVCDGVS